tara:strand:- start:1708 stop:1926 length:219 start_codon:yes stop_codon:yes gene_type:complete
MIALAGEMQGSCKTPLGYVWRERSGGDRREMNRAASGQTGGSSPVLEVELKISEWTSMQVWILRPMKVTPRE